MLKQNEVKILATKFAQHQKDFEREKVAHNQASMRWDEVIRLLQKYDPEDGDRERIIEECRAMKYETVALVRSIHRAFDALGIVGKKIATPAPTRRARIIKSAVARAYANKGAQVGNHNLDTAIAIEQKVGSGQVEGAAEVLKNKVWNEFNRIGLLIRDHYDVMTIEEVASYFSEEYVKAWHHTHDEGIEAEIATQKPKEAKGE